MWGGLSQSSCVGSASVGLADERFSATNSPGREVVPLVIPRTSSRDFISVFSHRDPQIIMRLLSGDRLCAPRCATKRPSAIQSVIRP